MKPISWQNIPLLSEHQDAAAEKVSVESLTATAVEGTAMKAFLGTKAAEESAAAAVHSYNR